MADTYTLVRDTAALIDFGAEGRLRVTGPNHEAAVNALFSGDLEMVPPYKGTVGLFHAAEGALIAIAIICKGDDELFIFTEEASARDLEAHLRSALAGQEVEIDDLAADHGWLGIVGPQAQEVAAKAAGDDILGLPYLGFEANPKLDLTLFRMGWCGEYEYRFLVRRDRIDDIRARLLEAGAGVGMAEGSATALPALMLEMRSLLRADVPGDADPIQAGLHWMIAFRKDELWAGAILNGLKADPPRRGLMVKLADAGRCDAGDALEIEGMAVGVLARVEHSPTLGHDIAFAYVRSDVGWVGVSFDVAGRRGRTVAKGVSAPLFVTKTVRTV